jgi:hypothetical protein
VFNIPATAKAWIGAFGSLASALAGVAADDVFDVTTETGVVIAAVMAAFTAVGVWGVPNQDA